MSKQDLKLYLAIAVLVLLSAVLWAPTIIEAQSKPLLTSTEPISSAVAVTPNNGTTFTTICRALYIGSDGNVTVDVQNGGTNLAFTGAKAGSILPIRVKRVYSTGTSSTGIVCLY